MSDNPWVGISPEKCDNCTVRPATKLILDSKDREVAEVCDECVPYYMRTVVERELRP